MANDERIGIILVHGIGEQRRFQHLSHEVRDLLEVLDSDENIRTSVDTRTTRDSSYLAENETWLAETEAPVRIDISFVAGELSGQRKSIFVHEVWWADLENKVTLLNRVKFWFWGLGMWNAKRFHDTILPGAKAGMRQPRLDTRVHVEILARSRLFVFGAFFLLTAVTWNLANALLRIVKLGQLPIPSEVLYQYVGDVKLYQDRGRNREGRLTDRGLPRRVAIRRRMVNALVAAHNQRYDRWYVLAHSMGSIVAFNGLMETAHALPNYLSKEAYGNLPDGLLIRDNDVDPEHVKNMRPRRPLWISNYREILDRWKLFHGLRGFVTYGSPLEKFAYLWPQIVSINKDNSVFCQKFEWINIFDHSDPVAGRIKAFPSAFGDGRGPKNLAYKAHWALLYSHTKYLRTSRRSSADTAPFMLVKWVLDGQRPFPVPQKSGWGTRWYKRKGLGFGLLLRSWMWTWFRTQSISASQLLSSPAERCSPPSFRLRISVASATVLASRHRGSARRSAPTPLLRLTAMQDSRPRPLVTFIRTLRIQVPAHRSTLPRRGHCPVHCGIPAPAYGDN